MSVQLGRELLELMHERVPEVERKLAEREERRARKKRELDLDTKNSLAEMRFMICARRSDLKVEADVLSCRARVYTVRVFVGRPGEHPLQHVPSNPSPTE